MTTTTTDRIARIAMFAGEYILGDPCYAVPNERWREWLEASNYDQPEGRWMLKAEIDGKRVLGFGTQYGDGCYPSTLDGFAFGVDAGLIGLVPIEIADRSPDASWRSMSKRVTFEQDFLCERLDNGTMIFDTIKVWTGDPDEDETNPGYDPYADEDEGEGW